MQYRHLSENDVDDDDASLTLNSSLLIFWTTTNCKMGYLAGRRHPKLLVVNRRQSVSLVIANCQSCYLRGSSESIILLLSKDVPNLTWRCDHMTPHTHSVPFWCYSVPIDVGVK